MDLETYKQTYAADDSAPGWEAIDARLKTVYGEQVPQHLRTSHPYVLGGPDPLDGISIYRSTESETHLHFVTYGMSELYYAEESVGAEYSRYGFEFSLRLIPSGVTENGLWVAHLLQNIARYVHASKKWFEAYHYIPANGPICLGVDTEVTALATVLDPELGSIETVHGRVDFIQFMGITQREYELLRTGTVSCEEFMGAEHKANPFFLTRLNRGGS